MDMKEAKGILAEEKFAGDYDIAGYAFLLGYNFGKTGSTPARDAAKKIAAPVTAAPVTTAPVTKENTK